MACTCTMGVDFSVSKSITFYIYIYLEALEGVDEQIMEVRRQPQVPGAVAVDVLTRGGNVEVA